jgi:hypothetical protein
MRKTRLRKCCKLWAVKCSGGRARAWSFRCDWFDEKTDANTDSDTEVLGRRVKDKWLYSAEVTAHE